MELTVPPIEVPLIMLRKDLDLVHLREREGGRVGERERKGRERDRTKKEGRDECTVFVQCTVQTLHYSIHSLGGCAGEGGVQGQPTQRTCTCIHMYMYYVHILIVHK